MGYRYLYVQGNPFKQFSLHDTKGFLGVPTFLEFDESKPNQGQKNRIKVFKTIVIHSKRCHGGDGGWCRIDRMEWSLNVSSLVEFLNQFDRLDKRIENRIDGVIEWNR